MAATETENARGVIDEKLLQATVKLNTVLFAGVCGMMASLTLLFVTYVALFRGLVGPDDILGVLGVFLPGYGVSHRGAWMGALWGGLLGAIAGAVMYRVYARSIRRQIGDYLAGDLPSESLEYLVIRIYGHPLGLALGGVAALGLLITTNALAIRDNPENSAQAALLVHYLPGYTVSFAGSIVGAAEIFVIAYLFCRLLGAIYNRVVELRQRGAGS